MDERSYPAAAKPALKIFTGACNDPLGRLAASHRTAGELAALAVPELADRIAVDLNDLPNFITEIDGLDIHFIHVRSQHEDALPLIVTHGWPGSIIEQLKIIEPLTNPTAHGASASDAFHLVIPSLPGYGFSAKLSTTGWDPARTARAWVALMKRLGYSRFVAQGGDWGAAVTQAMGVQAAPELLAFTPTCLVPPSRHQQGGPARRPAATGPVSRGATRVRAAEHLLRQARGLRADHDDTTADTVRTGGLTSRPRSVHA
jgi:pimeloyl-ACP methyl ester carboxylesterase